MKTRILLIDDDAEALADLQRKLESAPNRWDIETQSDPTKALDTILLDPPNVVICDQHMADTCGADFLKEIESKHPQIQTFIIADPETKELLDSGTGGSFQYLPKPCPKDTLLRELQRVVALDDWLGREKIKTIVSSISDFPSLPPMYMKVVNAVNSPTASTDKIADAIMGDIAITAKLLQTVNSSFFGLDEKVSDISHAISVLGIENVKNIVLAIQVFGRMKDADLQALIDQLWHHSMSVATAAKRIVKYETGSEKAAEEAYTSGLFHDLGKLVLIKSLPDQYNEARELAASDKIPAWEAENKVIGCNHADIGAYLLGRWGMPVSIIEATALHHNPSDSFSSEFSSLAAVHAGNAIVWARHPGEEPHPDSVPNEEYLAHIGRISRWDAWQDAAAGKVPPKKATPNTANSDQTPTQPQEEDEISNTVSAPTTTSLEDHRETTSSASKRKSSKKLLIGSVAAILAIGGWVIVTQTSHEKSQKSLAEQANDWPSEPANTDWEETSPELVEVTETEPLEAEPTESAIPEAATEEAESKEPESPPELAATNTEPIAAEPKIKAEEPIDTFPQIRLTGIFYNQSNPLASVNGKIRRRGDSVSGAQIVTIGKTYIAVRHNGEDRRINLPK